MLILALSILLKYNHTTKKYFNTNLLHLLKLLISVFYNKLVKWLKLSVEKSSLITMVVSTWPTAKL